MTKYTASKMEISQIRQHYEYKKRKFVKANIYEDMSKVYYLPSLKSHCVTISYLVGVLLKKVVSIPKTATIELPATYAKVDRAIHYYEMYKSASLGELDLGNAVLGFDENTLPNAEWILHLSYYIMPNHEFFKQPTVTVPDNTILADLNVGGDEGMDPRGLDRNYKQLKLKEHFAKITHDYKALYEADKMLVRIDRLARALKRKAKLAPARLVEPVSALIAIVLSNSRAELGMAYDVIARFKKVWEEENVNTELEKAKKIADKEEIKHIRTELEKIFKIGGIHGPGSESHRARLDQIRILFDELLISSDPRRFARFYSGLENIRNLNAENEPRQGEKQSTGIINLPEFSEIDLGAGLGGKRFPQESEHTHLHGSSEDFNDDSFIRKFSKEKKDEDKSQTEYNVLVGESIEEGDTIKEDKPAEEKKTKKGDNDQKLAPKQKAHDKVLQKLLKKKRTGQILKNYTIPVAAKNLGIAAEISKASVLGMKAFSRGKKEIYIALMFWKLALDRDKAAIEKFVNKMNTYIREVKDLGNTARTDINNTRNRFNIIKPGIYNWMRTGKANKNVLNKNLMNYKEAVETLRKATTEAENNPLLNELLNQYTKASQWWDTALADVKNTISSFVIGIETMAKYSKILPTNFSGPAPNDQQQRDDRSLIDDQDKSQWVEENPDVSVIVQSFMSFDQISLPDDFEIMNEKLEAMHIPEDLLKKAFTKKTNDKREASIDKEDIPQQMGPENPTEETVPPARPTIDPLHPAEPAEPKINLEGESKTVNKEQEVQQKEAEPSKPKRRIGNTKADAVIKKPRAVWRKKETADMKDKAKIDKGERENEKDNKTKDAKKKIEKKSMTTTTRGVGIEAKKPMTTNKHTTTKLPAKPEPTASKQDPSLENFKTLLSNPELISNVLLTDSNQLIELYDVCRRAVEAHPDENPKNVAEQSLVSIGIKASNPALYDVLVKLF